MVYLFGIDHFGISGPEVVEALSLEMAGWDTSDKPGIMDNLLTVAQSGSVSY